MDVFEYLKNNLLIADTHSIRTALITGRTAYNNYLQLLIDTEDLEGADITSMRDYVCSNIAVYEQAAGYLLYVWEQKGYNFTPRPFSHRTDWDKRLRYWTALSKAEHINFAIKEIR